MQLGDVRGTIGSISILMLAACGAASDLEPQAAGGSESSGPLEDDTAAAPGLDDDGGVGSGGAEPTGGDAEDEGGQDEGGQDEGGDPPAGSTGGDGPSDGTSTGEPAGPGLGCDGRSDLLLCDDFEGASIDEGQWTILDDNGATATVDTELPFHGEQSLHLHLPVADGAHAGLRTTLPFPVADNHFFGRAMFYVTPEAPQTHSSALAARGNLDGATAQYRLDSNGGELNSRYTHTPTVEQHGGLRKFGYDVPVQQWLCIEWEYDGGNDTMRYWMDGVEVESMTVTADSEDQPWIAPVFDDFEVGYRTYQAGSVAEGYDVYWDAVALATFRVGCGD